MSSVDYAYFIEDKEKKALVAIVQVTFEDGLGLSHQENFTIVLKVDQKNKPAHVQELKHGIAKEYRSKIE